METDRLGGDILAERRLTKEEFIAALSSLLSISPEKIVTFNDWQELPEKPDQTKVYARFWQVEGGEFHTVIDLPDHLLHNLPRHLTALRLAKILGCRLLVDDGSWNPCAYILYDPSGAVEAVHIDFGEAEDRDRIVICRE